ncbi:hypothetical protein [Pseudoxanthomonas winnipegensis]|uniref:hypothetical protein n=1 Tax=Pseudoxanthomonas winnipegensis TaxID=2480810 RepID=UPI00102DB3ED|nr:hypothetical protein [Pseudoxanthomonas winnipegensis]RZZ85665.1 hypothetical protein EA663_11685 [Pseudoxanthomonas winnipegensis]
MQQLTLSFEAGLSQRYRDMRECFAACVYQRGLGRVAAAIDVAPSNLSAMLSGERNLDPSLVEKYMAEFKDTTPAQYWAARWLQDANTRQQQALAQLPNLVDQLNRLMAVAGQAA